MATKKTLKGRVQHPFLTAAVLRAANPVLLAGEVVYESDSGKHKVGDGKTVWNNLAYEVAQLPDNIPASMISGDAAHRFVTDTEKSTWNNKAAKDLSNVLLSKNFAERGYYKAPDGLLLQWGTINGSSSASGTTVYFPISFYSVPPFAVLTTCINVGSAVAVPAALVTSRSLGSFVARTVWANSGSQGHGQEVYMYLAIGRWK